MFAWIDWVTGSAGRFAGKPGRAGFGLAVALMVADGTATPVLAWDYEVHRLINQLALESLPTNYPAFVREPAAAERLAFLGGEPDRWRNTPDLHLRHCNGPDHFLDIEDLALYGLAPERLTAFRYELVAQLAEGRIRYASNFAQVDFSRDLDRTRWLPGFLPWTIAEYYSKVKSAYSCLREFEAAGTAEERRNAQENIIAFMGIMGHFVGDATQPLHTTRHYNGWVGPNPRGYTTSRGFHAWIDGGFLRVAGVDTNALRARLRTARTPWPESPLPNTNCFPEALAYVLAQSRFVEPLYQMELQGHFKTNQPMSEVGRDFLGDQILKAAQMLGDLWLAAWQEAPEDKFLKNELARRKSGSRTNKSGSSANP